MAEHKEITVRAKPEKAAVKMMRAARESRVWFRSSFMVAKVAASLRWRRCAIWRRFCVPNLVVTRFSRSTSKASARAKLCFTTARSIRCVVVCCTQISRGW